MVFIKVIVGDIYSLPIVSGAKLFSKFISGTMNRIIGLSNLRVSRKKLV
jgi:hypothetical protein